ncbi:hypothetical protein ATM97_27390 [Nocardia sp. MH4]|uniref:hypothetical protein n=1 Tax=Nocardia sp. MH4 TaxID=1768677 RepID=UPI001C4E8420|nr:hypothetical protein [Nocardia sp. MH4]MBW0274931.1 hypothetical protein [Nocardia sp. MH4]
MTNSQQGSGDQPGQSDPTVHWWSTPTNAGADPTVFNPAAGPEQPQPGFGFPAQGQPGYGPYPSAPSMPQAGYPPQPTPPYNAPGYQQPAYAMPPRPPGNKNGLIIAGVVGLLAVVSIGVVGVAVATRDDPSDPLTSMENDRKKKMEGDYTMASVSNACSLIDPTVLKKWSSDPKGSPEHKETQPTSSTGGRLSCTADYSSKSARSKYQTNDARIELDVEFNDAYGDPSYTRWKEYDTGTSGSGLASGEVSGIGSQGYWKSETRDVVGPRLTYTVGVADSNVSVKVQITLSRAEGETINTDEVATVAKAQAQKALTGLKK